MDWKKMSDLCIREARTERLPEATSSTGYFISLRERLLLPVEFRICEKSDLVHRCVIETTVLSSCERHAFQLHERLISVFYQELEASDEEGRLPCVPSGSL